MKTHLKKYGIYYIIALVLLVLLYVFRKSSKTPDNSGSIFFGSKDSNKSESDLLSKGDRGEMVKRAQRALNRFYSFYPNLYGISSVNADGIFGSNTEEAVETMLGKTSASVLEIEAHVNETVPLNYTTVSMEDLTEQEIIDMTGGMDWRDLDPNVFGLPESETTGVNY